MKPEWFDIPYLRPSLKVCLDMKSKKENMVTAVQPPHNERKKGKDYRAAACLDSVT